MIKYKNPDLGLLVLRLGLSIVFFFESITKINNLDKTAKFFVSIGFNVPMLYFVIAVELVAAIVFLLGVFRPWGIVIAIEMLVIIFKLQLPSRGLGGSLFELTILVAALALAIGGYGKYSLDEKLKKTG